MTAKGSLDLYIPCYLSLLKTLACFGSVSMAVPVDSFTSHFSLALTVHRNESQTYQSSGFPLAFFEDFSVVFQGHSNLRCGRLHTARLSDHKDATAMTVHEGLYMEYISNLSRV